MWKVDCESLVLEEIGIPAEASSELQPLRYSAIGVSDQCLWWRAHRLRKVVLKDGLRPDFGFHEIPPTSWGSEGKSPEKNPADPVLDVTVINDGARLGAATAVGLELVHTWTDMKGLAVAERVPVSDVYILKLESIGFCRLGSILFT